jgi:hypothetical protein
LRSILMLSSHLGLGLPSRILPSCFPTRATCLIHLILFSFTTLIIVYLLNITNYEAHYIIFPTPLTPLSLSLSLSNRSIHLSILFSNTLNLYSSFKVKDQVSDPYQTQEKYFC